MSNPKGVLKGEELQKILADQILQHQNGIFQKLRNLEAQNTFTKWLEIIRSIDEFINIIFFELKDGDDYNHIARIPLTLNAFNSSENIDKISTILTKRFTNEITRRFISLVIMTVAIGNAFKVTGQDKFGHDLNLNNIANAALFFQSRRKHLITLLYLIPTYCRGQERYNDFDCLNHFLPVIEHSFVGLTTINHQLLLSKIYDDFEIISDGNIMHGNYHINNLERLFMEPERISILDQSNHRAQDYNNDCYKNIDKSKVLSKDELKCFMLTIECSYSDFNLSKNIYGDFRRIISEILTTQQDDYYITINAKDFNFILNKADAKIRTKIEDKLIFTKANCYSHASISRNPFIKISGKYTSNVVLINAFMNQIKNQELNKNKRYQIHSGFIFEDMIQEKLKNNNFLITSIKRINRKEFDVVTLRNNSIYNFQCKNNFLELDLLYTDQQELIKKNKQLISYYIKSLEKEENRESLLQNKLNTKTIKHLLVSRFPVITDNPRIINFNNLQNWIDNYQF